MGTKDRRTSCISNKSKDNVCAMLKVKFGLDYRSMESHLRSRPDLLEIMELKKAPSKTVINDGLKRIPMPYLKKVNAKLTEPIKKKT